MRTTLHHDIALKHVPFRLSSELRDILVTIRGESAHNADEMWDIPLEEGVCDYHSSVQPL